MRTRSRIHSPKWLRRPAEPLSLSPAFSLTLGIIGYYKFENNLLDSTGNARHLTADTAASYTTGKLGQGLQNDSCRKASLSVSYSALTIAAWFNRVGGVGTGGIYLKNGATITEGLELDGTSATGLTAISLGSGTAGLSFGTTGVWRHLVAVSTSAGGFDVYLNGAILANIGSGPTTGTITEIVAKGTTGSVLVDEYGAWARTLSAAEIAQLYNGGSGYSPY